MADRHQWLWYRVPVIGYCLLIFLQSSRASMAPDLSISFFDKILHFGGYGLLGFLMMRLLVKELPQQSRSVLIILASALCIAYGISDEFHQSFIPCRSADVLDVLADAAGSLAGVFCFVIAGSYWHRIS